MTSKAIKAARILQQHVHGSYMRPAREAIAAEVGQTRTSLIKQTHRRLNAIYNRADDLKIKLEAVRQLAGLYGLNAPSQVAVTVDVLYNPEEQLRALSDPIMLEKVLALDAEFEAARLGHGNGCGNPGTVPDGEDVDPGAPGLPGSEGL
jgi:hypothetical protein